MHWSVASIKMTGIEPMISRVGGNRSADCATVTALILFLFQIEEINFREDDISAEMIPVPQKKGRGRPRKYLRLEDVLEWRLQREEEKGTSLDEAESKRGVTMETEKVEHGSISPLLNSDQSEVQMVDLNCDELSQQQQQERQQQQHEYQVQQPTQLQQQQEQQQHQEHQVQQPTQLQQQPTQLQQQPTQLQQQQHQEWQQHQEHQVQQPTQLQQQQQHEYHVQLQQHYQREDLQLLKQQLEVTESTTSDEGRHLVPTDVDLNEKVLHNNINNISNNINNNSDEDDYFGYGIDSQADEVDSPGSFHDIFMA